MQGRKWVGKSLTRREDVRFLTGQGRYTDDCSCSGAAHVAFVRSPHAHARLGAIDASQARAMPGVLAVWSAADIADEIASPIPSLARTPPYDVRNRDGSSTNDPSPHPLATEQVRFAGEAVAMVIAESAAEARDAAEAVAVDYQPLPALATLAAARATDAPLLWDDAPGNRSLDWECGDAAAVQAALAEAAHVTRRTLVNNRIVPAFMEPRAAIGEFDAASGRYTLTTGAQSANRLRGILATVLGVEAARVRVVIPDVGGGFGARGTAYAEMPLVLLAARRLGRPVRWTASRSECFLTDNQARDHTIHGELALDADGRFTALRARVEWRHGAYLTTRGLWVMTAFMPPTLGGVYAIPAAYLSLQAWFSNTTPQSAFRGVGRVEATYLIESLVDAAARETGVDRVELRRRNVVQPAQMPWRAAGGSIYTSGEFAANLEQALKLADWNEFTARRRDAEARGLRRGIGVALCVENDGGAPAEFAEVEVLAASGSAEEGEVVVYTGTQNFGMAHETTYAQALADELGLEPARIRVVEGDTDLVRNGAGSHGSRSMRIGGAAMVLGARAMLARARTLAAELLEVDESMLDYADGRFAVREGNRFTSLFDVAAAAAGRGERLSAEHTFTIEAEAHSNGCQVCELEVDPDTGVVRVVRHVFVADVGTAINPLVVDGQLHGGVAQGIGQAAMENATYDEDSGQLLSGSFMDYTLPRADDLPYFVTALNEVAEVDNPLGVKGAGELGTSGAPAAWMNALRDALGEAADRVQMPATPEQVWRALKGT